MMDVAVVTGGTGFIGSHLVRLLIERGVPKVVVTGISGSARRLEEVREQIEVERADLGIFSDLLRLVEKHRPQTIFHTGAMLAPACDSDPEAGIRANALGTYHVLEAARLFGARQVIFASSMSVFGGASTTSSIVDDNSTTHPDTVYAAAKLFSENLGLCYRRLYGLDYRGIRLPNVNGPGTTTHGYLEYFNKAIEESAQGQPYSIYVEPHVRVPILHVADAARAFIDLATAPRDAIRTINYTILGPTPAPTAQDLVTAIKAKLPDAKLDFQVDRRISALIDAVGGQPFDDQYARSEWGWRHQYDLSRIIESFIVAQNDSQHSHPQNSAQ
jgi:threonine 3-dehydrogenase